MPGRSLALSLACVALIVVGQLMLKAAASQWRVDGTPWDVARSFLSPIMISALALYGVATLLWVYVLRTVPLGPAYAIFSLAFVLVPVVAHFALGEPLTPRTLIGGAMIVAGVVVATR